MPVNLQVRTESSGGQSPTQIARTQQHARPHTGSRVFGSALETLVQGMLPVWGQIGLNAIATVVECDRVHRGRRPGPDATPLLLPSPCPGMPGLHARLDFDVQTTVSYSVKFQQR